MMLEVDGDDIPLINKLMICVKKNCLFVSMWGMGTSNPTCELGIAKG